MPLDKAATPEALFVGKAEYCFAPKASGLAAGALLSPAALSNTRTLFPTGATMVTLAAARPPASAEGVEEAYSRFWVCALPRQARLNPNSSHPCRAIPTPAPPSIRRLSDALLTWVIHEVMQESAARDWDEHGHEIQPMQDTCGPWVIRWLMDRPCASSRELADLRFASHVMAAFVDLEEFDPYLFRENMWDLPIAFFDGAMETACADRRPRHRSYAVAAASAIPPPPPPPTLPPQSTRGIQPLPPRSEYHTSTHLGYALQLGKKKVDLGAKGGDLGLLVFSALDGWITGSGNLGNPVVVKIDEPLWTRMSDAPWLPGGGGGALLFLYAELAPLSRSDYLGKDSAGDG
ncbi:hypothetical protein BDK51DRAFT_43356 [Blyttiomyces helicus]|uniref:Uncharacterized protein n=1 Tax=Blyttiomyces helicus TaxID=388810 RepID=A0A4P9W3U6_9FUNG|nr:hypothetical protein BDK51DRAFT_43356 [Blyttiomyces helicus]|eukprot:RKO87001.1 hypothetical protein BDK51DRAFT_43356 [Blyttiomyces helicus]